MEIQFFKYQILLLLLLNDQKLQSLFYYHLHTIINTFNTIQNLQFLVNILFLLKNIYFKVYNLYFVLFILIYHQNHLL